jgi:hypothetical protein
MNVFATRPTQVLNPRFFDNHQGDEGMGWVGAVVGAGSSILGPLIGKLFAPCGGANVACGLQGITSFGNNAISTLQQILQMVTSNPPMVSPQDAISNAQRIASALGDGTIIYQAKKGKDAAALAQFKTQANALVQEITAAATQAQAALQAKAAPVSMGGTSVNPTVLMLGGAAVLLMVLKR